MIQLANDPRARDIFLRAPGAAKTASDAELRRARPGHAWPFLSRYAERPAQKEATPKPAANDSGS